MVKKEVMLVFAIVFFIGLISAQSIITVHVKAQPAQDVFTTVLRPGDGYNALGTQKIYTEYEDTASFEFPVEGSLSSFNIIVIIKNLQGEKIYDERFDGVDFTPVYVDTLVDVESALSNEPFVEKEENELEIEELSNETIEENNGLAEETIEETDEAEIQEETVSENQASENNSSGAILTGNQISDFTNSLSNSTFYIVAIGGVLGLLFIVLLVRRTLKPGKKEKIIDNPEPPTVFDDNKLKDAEKKLKMAREELREMQNEIANVEIKKRKIEEVKRKIEADKRELEGLEGPKGP